MELNYKMVNLVNDFYAYSEKNGLRISKEACREIFASLASSKFIYTPKGYYYNLIGQLLSGFFGGEFLMETVDSSWQGPAQLAQRLNGEETNITKTMRIASNNPAMVVLGGLDNIDFTNMNYFEEIRKYIRAPKIDFAYMVKDGQILTKENLWIWGSSNGLDRFNMPFAISKYSTYLEERDNVLVANLENNLGATGRIANIIINTSPITFLDFDELVRESVSEFGISLENWKKFDRLENYLSLMTNFSFNNIVLRQFERYSACFMACEGNENQAIDALLAYKILPPIGGFQKNQLNTLNVPLRKFIYDLFGEENLPITKTILDKLGL